MCWVLEVYLQTKLTSKVLYGTNYTYLRNYKLHAKLGDVTCT